MKGEHLLKPKFPIVVVPVALKSRVFLTLNNLIIISVCEAMKWLNGKSGLSPQKNILNKEWSAELKNAA